MVDKYEKKFQELGHGSWPKIMTDKRLSEFGKVQGNVFYIRGPEVIKGSGIRAADIGLAALAATAGLVTHYKIGKDGKKIKIGTPTPKDTGPKRLTAKENPLKKFKTEAHGGKIKKYAIGGGVRRAARYS